MLFVPVFAASHLQQRTKDRQASSWKSGPVFWAGLYFRCLRHAFLSFYKCKNSKIQSKDLNWEKLLLLLHQDPAESIVNTVCAGNKKHVEWSFWCLFNFHIAAGFYRFGAKATRATRSFKERTGSRDSGWLRNCTPPHREQFLDLRNCQPTLAKNGFLGQGYAM